MILKRRKVHNFNPVRQTAKVSFLKRNIPQHEYAITLLYAFTPMLALGYPNVGIGNQTQMMNGQLLVMFLYGTTNGKMPPDVFSYLHISNSP